MDKSKLLEIPGGDALFTPVEEVKEEVVEETPTSEEVPEERVEEVIEEVPAEETEVPETTEETVEENKEVPEEAQQEARKDIALFASDIFKEEGHELFTEEELKGCLLYTSPSPRD